MTALNYVTVTASWQDGNGDVGSGNYFVSASGTLVSGSGTTIDIAAVDGQLDATGSLSVKLLASDNYASGVLTYDWRLDIEGEDIVNASDIAVNFNDGGSS